MFNNKNIVKYCVKYFVLINQKSDVANLIGTALFAGLFVGTILILKSDVTKLAKSVNGDNKNE